MNFRIEFKSIAVILGLTTGLFQSCSVEKRYHSGGYSFSVFDKIASSKTDYSLKNNSNSPKKKSPLIHNNNSLSEDVVSHPSIDRNRSSTTIKTTATQLVQQNNSTQQCAPAGHKNIRALAIKYATEKQYGDEQMKFTSPINKLQIQANNASRGSNVFLGIILLIAAAYFFWNISMLIGVILFFIALFVMSSGKSKNRNRNDNSEESEGKMVDVVYLKNGSVIVGTIVEQIPNETIKIQTRDGSVFVYQYSDITKMTKEKR